MSKRKRRKPNDRPFAGPLMRAWRSEMGWSERDASKHLGMSRGGLRNAEAEGGPLYLAYACAALINNIKPYGLNDREYGRQLAEALKRQEEE